MSPARGGSRAGRRSPKSILGIAPAAKGPRAAYLNATYTYTRTGILKLRIPFRTYSGTYDVSAATFHLKERPGATFHFRLKDGKLYLTQPDGHSEDVYVRDDN